jgi:hypothetical protein
MAAGAGRRRGGLLGRWAAAAAAGGAVTALVAGPVLAGGVLAGRSVLVSAPALAAVRPAVAHQPQRNTGPGRALAHQLLSQAAHGPALAHQPLDQAGRGWALAMYATGRDVSRGRVTLYLTSPAGSAYALHRWRRGTAWQLQAWSPDRFRAIFASPSVTGGLTSIHQMALASGATTTFTLPPFSRVIGYALPAGRSVLVAEDSGIYLYSLTGIKLARLSAVAGQGSNLGSGGAVMSRTGQEVVVPARAGLALVSRAGVLLRRLPVPDTSGACLPVRWDSAGVVVATCTPSAPSSGPQVFRVPVSGSVPVAVTAVQNFTSGQYGDIDAWTIAGATYVQAEQSCGAGFLGRVGAGGSVVPVSIPSHPESSVVDAVSGRRLLITETGCQNRNGLVQLTLPGAAERTILPYGRGAGVVGVIPYDRDGSQP